MPPRNDVVCLLDSFKDQVQASCLYVCHPWIVPKIHGQNGDRNSAFDYSQSGYKHRIPLITILPLIFQKIRNTLVGQDDGPKPEIQIKADESKLRQVFQNLLDNAIKYTETAWIKIKLYALSSTLKIVISHSGLGIPQDVLPLLFEQFVRSSGETKKIQGTGLGLYIAKQFMKAHHGDITASSPGPGKGSSFTVEMPIV